MTWMDSFGQSRGLLNPKVKPADPEKYPYHLSQASFVPERHSNLSVAERQEWREEMKELIGNAAYHHSNE